MIVWDVAIFDFAGDVDEQAKALVRGARVVLVAWEPGCLVLTGPDDWTSRWTINGGRKQLTTIMQELKRMGKVQ